MNDFPELPKIQLSREELVRYLQTLKAAGHDVFRDPAQDNVFYLGLNDQSVLRLSVGDDGRGQVQLQYMGNVVDWRDVSSMPHAEATVADFARRALGSWPTRPTSARLDEAKPASNLRTISELIGSAQIEAVFDPYLENGALAVLVDMQSFGSGTVASGVRLLGSKVKASGSIPRFTKAGVDAWFTQLGIQGEGRVMSSSSEHRRFMLLSGGQSLLIGASWNAIQKNEAVRVESDVEDRPFFDQAWSTATPLT